MKKKKRKPWILVISLLIILILSALGVMIYMNAALEDYFNNSTRFCEIPDISKGFIPQGVTYDPATDHLFLTGYMDNGKNSPIYVMDGKTGEYKNKILMLTEAGEKFHGHAGGISVYAGDLYVAGSTDKCTYSFSIGEALKAEKGSSLSASRRINLKTEDDFIRVSFTSFDDSLLYAGEFHKDPIFYTHESHLVKDENVKQKAYLFGFSFDEDGNVVPGKVYSIPDNVQGACFDDSYVYLSQSHGFMPSSILSYSLEDLKPSGTKVVLGKEIPLYVLTEDNAKKETQIPPMSEEIVVANGKMFVLYEAASNRYVIGKFLHQDYVYATPIEYFR